MSGSEPSKLATYDDLFDRILDATFILDAESFAILQVNDAFERILGLPSEAVLGKLFVQWVDVSCRDQTERALRITRRRYHPHLFELRWIRADGTFAVISASACALNLSDGTRVLQVVARDITHQRETERKAEKYFRELQDANAKLVELSVTDEMTRLHNFRHFKTQLAIEHERGERYGTPYSLIFCDVDHFKNFNDRNGHPAGDQLLKELGGLLRGLVRRTDLAARYGGEEFVVICAGVPWSSAVVLADRIREAVEEHPFEHGGSQPLGKVTVSIGVASYPADGATAEAVLAAADEALYRSKESGRNRVCTAHASRKKTAA